VSLPKDTARDPRADALLTAALHAADGVEASGCPDAEEMGLYVERELAGVERRAVEAHVHTCPRCQAIVAAFVRALPDEGETADVVAGAGEASAGGGFAAWFAGWRWLVPAASLTAVALVAVWVGRDPADQGAESARGAAAMTETDAAVPATPAAQSTQARQAEAFVPPVSSSSAVAGAAMVDRRAPSATPMVARQEVAGVLADRATAANIAPSEKTAAGATREAAAEAAPAAPPVQETLAVTQAPPAPPALAEASAERRAGPAQTLGANDAAVFRVRPAVSFRLRAGAVERSLDQGATWHRAPLPAGGTVLAVTSPAPGVCWAIAADAVLRATDGATFTREPVPTAERLTAITATDAMRAVVTAASGARFATTDGGRTWVPAQ
jgi:hypothetical protein